LVEALPRLIVKEATHSMALTGHAGQVRNVKVVAARLGDRAM